MEARDAEGDPNDLWVTFNSMGYNKVLEPDQVCFYVVFFCIHQQPQYSLLLK